jgi:hypothetical protein
MARVLQKSGTVLSYRALAANLAEMRLKAPGWGVKGSRKQNLVAGGWYYDWFFEFGTC